jgi:hypothetical protein
MALFYINGYHGYYIYVSASYTYHQARMATGVRRVRDKWLGLTGCVWIIPGTDNEG